MSRGLNPCKRESTLCKLQKELDRKFVRWWQNWYSSYSIGRRWRRPFDERRTDRQLFDSDHLPGAGSGVMCNSSKMLGGEPRLTWALVFSVSKGCSASTFHPIKVKVTKENEKGCSERGDHDLNSLGSGLPPFPPLQQSRTVITPWSKDRREKW